MASKTKKWLSEIYISGTWLHIISVDVYICSFYFFLYLPVITLLLFSELILNAVYFIAYVTLIFVLIFYSWTFWRQYVETKYSALKMQIYEVCEESMTLVPDYDDDDEDNNEWGGDNINAHFDGYHHISDDSVGTSHRINNAGNNGSDGDNNYNSNKLKVVTKWKYNHNNEPMISKQLYNRIRETILPYNLTLFHFFIKVLFVFLFAFFLSLCLQ